MGKGVEIDKSLCLYSPRQVYSAILENKRINSWLEFISNRYEFPKKDILLVYPCSTTKPYNESQSYKQLFKTLEKLPEAKRDKIHLLTISEPFGLVPSEYYNDSFEWYDCPGLFKWWCSKHGVTYEDEYLEKSIDLLADYVGRAINRAVSEFGYTSVVGFVRTFTSSLETKKDHTHRRILEKAAEMYDLDIELLPHKSAVQRIVRNRGHFAWDMYGPAHPIAQKALEIYLRDNV